MKTIILLMTIFSFGALAQSLDQQVGNVASLKLEFEESNKKLAQAMAELDKAKSKLERELAQNELDHQKRIQEIENMSAEELLQELLNFIGDNSNKKHTSSYEHVNNDSEIKAVIIHQKILDHEKGGVVKN